METNDIREDVVDSFRVRGNIIITDPCYLKYVRGGLEAQHERDTIYGDWSCSVWDYNPTVSKGPKDGQKPIGKFCADSGMVCVTEIPSGKLLDTIDYFGDTHMGTIIRKFDGIVKYIELVDSKGNRNLIIRGKGRRDGDPYAFVTRQTGL